MKTARSNKRLWTVLATVAMILGAAVRLYHGWGIMPSFLNEPNNMATAIAAGRGLSDPYFAGSGPSAHLLPVSPLIIGEIYFAFGTHSVSSQAILELIALIEIFAGFLLAARLFRALGLRHGFVCLGLIALSISPVYANREAFDFKFWEAPLAILLFFLALNLLLALRHPQHSGHSLATGGLIAFTAFVSPPLGISLCVIGAVAAGRARTLRTTALAFAGFALMATATFGLWAWRNEMVLGRPIAMRSNFGLELALANYRGAINQDSNADFNNRLQKIHPTNDGPGRAEYKREGELKYFDDLKIEAIAWITQNKSDFFHLMLRHVWEMVIPPAWLVLPGKGSGTRAFLLGLTNVFGIVGLLVGAWKINRLIAYGLLHIGIIISIYAAFQPTQRYIYLNYEMTVFGIMVLLQCLIKRQGRLFRLQPEA